MYPHVGAGDRSSNSITYPATDLFCASLHREAHTALARHTYIAARLSPSWPGHAFLTICLSKACTPHIAASASFDTPPLHVNILIG